MRKTHIGFIKAIIIMGSMVIAFSACRNPLADYIYSPGISVYIGEQRVKHNETYDMGELTVGEPAEVAVVIENTGNEVLELTGTGVIEFDGDHGVFFSLKEPVSTSISPGQQISGTIVCTATAATGQISARAVIANNDAKAASFLINITGSAVKELDTTPPAVEGISCPYGTITGSKPVPFTIKFSEPVVNFIQGNISVTVDTGSFTLSDFASNAVGDTYTFKVDPSAGLVVITVNVEANVTSDQAGNYNTAASQPCSVTYDESVLTVYIGPPISDPTNEDSIELDVEFSQEVTGFDESDVTIDNGWYVTFVNGTNNPDFVVHIHAGSEGDVNVSIPEDAVTSVTTLRGNSASNDYSFEYDATPPGPPTVYGATPTYDTTPTWNWTPNATGPGNGTFRYKLDDDDLTIDATVTTQTEYTQSSPLGQGIHTLYVQERDDAGNWSDSGSKGIEILVPLDDPIIQEITALDADRLDIAWYAYEDGNADYLELQRKREVGGEYTTIDDEINPGDTIYHDSGLDSDTTYFYRLRAIDSGVGTSDWSDTYNKDTDALIAPSDLTVLAIGEDQINLYWNDNSIYEEHYMVERNGVTIVSDLPPGTTSYEDDGGLDSNTEYTYTVYATDGGGESPSDSESDFTHCVAGDAEVYTADDISFTMVHVPGYSEFPSGVTDGSSASVTHAYWIGETETTYELWYEVRIWAEAQGMNSYSFYYDGREGDDGTTGASPDDGSEPVTYIYEDDHGEDYVVWCNALTEWYNAKTDSDLTCVYYTQSEDILRSYASGYLIDSAADGFRLVTKEEWELAARWRDDSVNTVNGYSDPYFTTGASASGAYTTAKDTADVNPDNGDPDGKDANDEVAVYGFYWDGSDYQATGVEHTAAVKSKNPNSLGLYDMSGNVWEICYDSGTGSSHSYGYVGGSYNELADSLQLGYFLEYSTPPGIGTGFRIARNADYKVGDIGPTGGMVFYDKGEYSDGWRYMEVGDDATEDYSDITKEWMSSIGNIPGAEGTAIGTGEENTEDIYDVEISDYYAGPYCYELSVNRFGEDFDDWFLPSRDELKLVYSIYDLFGPIDDSSICPNGIEFNSYYYWTSSEYSDEEAWVIYFNDGQQSQDEKYDSHYVRPVRVF